MPFDSFPLRLLLSKTRAVTVGGFCSVSCGVGSQILSVSIHMQCWLFCVTVKTMIFLHSVVASFKVSVCKLTWHATWCFDMGFCPNELVAWRNVFCKNMPDIPARGSLTHPFACHSLPGYGILGQVDFPKRALWNMAAGARSLIGPLPWKQ